MTTKILKNSDASWCLPSEFFRNSFEILSEFLVLNTALADGKVL